MDVPPVPTLQRGPRPKLVVCPPPQPGMVVYITPPPLSQGLLPFTTTVLCVVQGVAAFVFSPTGVLPVPLQAWPPDDVAEVYTATGELLWSRRFQAGIGIMVDAPPEPG